MLMPRIEAVWKCVVDYPVGVKLQIKTCFHSSHFHATRKLSNNPSSGSLVQGRYAIERLIAILRHFTATNGVSLSSTRIKHASTADNTQLGKVALTSAKRPSVKYLRRDDFPTVESPMRMSLEVSEKGLPQDVFRTIIVQSRMIFSDFI